MKKISLLRCDSQNKIILRNRKRTVKDFYSKNYIYKKNHELFIEHGMFYKVIYIERQSPSFHSYNGYLKINL